MSNAEWDRPGIIPGLQENIGSRRTPPKRASVGVFGYVADPGESKTLVIGEAKTSNELEVKETTHTQSDVDSKPATSPPTEHEPTLQVYLFGKR